MSADPPLINLDDVAIKKLIARAKKRGVITVDELHEALPQDEMSSEQIEDILSAISDMGVQIVEELEKEIADGLENEDDVREPEVVNNDLILSGKMVRIARIPDRWFGRWSKAPGLEARLYNRIARENALEIFVGFLAGEAVHHLNLNDCQFVPTPIATKTCNHEMVDETIFVVTEATYWWAELSNSRDYDPAQLKWTQTDHKLPNGSLIPILTPNFAGENFQFKCPSQPQHPSILTDETKLLRNSWGEMTVLDPCAAEIEPIFSDPLCPTARFRRALNALRIELAAHGILADDDHLNGFSGRQARADIEINVDFLALNSLSPGEDFARFQMDSISACFDFSVATYANDQDPNATQVEWRDEYEHHCRMGSPEITMAEEQISSLIWYTAGTEDRMKEAMYLCQRLAPRFGLRVEFEGNVEVAAEIHLDDSISYDARLTSASG